MPLVDTSKEINGCTSVTWDWDGSESDLRAFMRAAQNAGAMASYAVAVERAPGERYWYGGAVRPTAGITPLNMRREIVGLQEQSATYIDADNYLGSADAWEFSGIGLSAQVWE